MVVLVFLCGKTMVVFIFVGNLTHKFPNKKTERDVPLSVE